MAGLHQRDQATANSIVVELKLEDFKPFAKYGALAGMEFQKYRTKAWHLAGETQRVPAQRMIDFTQSRVSSEIPKTSYVPGNFRRNGTTVSWILNSNIAGRFF
jgi:uncharacterized FAD-dependent dehydrogenase